jgi:hypothetical protein
MTTTNKGTDTTIQSMGNGVSYQILDGQLCLRIDLANATGMSSTGKNMMVASSGGNQAVAFGNTLFKVGLNVFRAPTAVEMSAFLKGA